MVQPRAELARGTLRPNPSEGVLYSVLAAHLETFLARADDAPVPGLPRYVVRELRSYLTCGVLAHGFARFRCFIETLTTLGQHAGTVKNLAFTPDGKTLITLGGEGTIKFWTTD